MAGDVSSLGIARISYDVGNADTGLLHLRIEDRSERRGDIRRLEDGIFAAVRTAFRRARRLRIGEIFHKQLRPSPLGRHPGSPDRQNRKKTHEPWPSPIAERTSRIWDRSKLEA